MVVANLLNLHAGYNGLVTGTEWLLLLAIGIKTVLVGSPENLLFILPVFGALTAAPGIKNRHTNPYVTACWRRRMRFSKPWTAVTPVG